MKQIKWFLTGMVTMLLIMALAGTGLATTSDIAKTLQYRDIKVSLDGKVLDLKDAAGNHVEPFMFDGTNYLPVRALAEALGLNVSWDAAANTIVLSSEKNTESESTPAPGGTITTGQKNAVARAKQYLSIMSFSRSGLIRQLKYEGYSEEEATYGADNCGADWNEQAAKKAQEYINLMAFSRQGLIDQLKYEGFTQSQAEYGVSKVGY